MPSLVTHYAMADTVYNSLPIKIQNKIDRPLYNVYSQSFDNFFYYNFFDLKKGDEIRSFGHIGHKLNTQLYLINIVKNIITLKLENAPKALAYLYGSINHYTMDATCHPHVYYKAGVFLKNNKETYKYRGKHTYVEKNIDAYYSLLLFKKPIYKLNIVNELLGNTTFSKSLITLMNKSFKDTYNKDNMGNYFVKSFNHSKKVISLLYMDRYGIKRNIYSFIDLFNRKNTPLKYYSLYIREPDVRCLNINKKEWNNPCDTTIKYHTSFIDLYNESVKKSLKIIKCVNDVLNGKKDINSLTKIIANISYRSGLPIENDKPIKYFEY